MKDKVLSTVDELSGEYLSVWEDVCNIESPTHFKAGVDAVGRYFIDIAKKRGWKVDVFSQPVAGDVVKITMNPDADGKPIALSGHMDTVHEVGSFGSPAVKIEGDRFYGPGANDCKGGIVLGFLAMDALYKNGYSERPVVMYLQSDEEGGGKYSNDATINYICEDAKDCIAFINLEGNDEGKVCIGRKGIVNFEFCVEGIEAHSAGCSTNGANAILQAAHMIIELEKYKDKSGLTCCCSLINGGTKHNIVPGRCEFKANVRFAKMSELEDFKAVADKICADIKVKGCSASYVIPRIRPAMEICDRNIELVDKLNAIWRECGMTELKWGFNPGGSDAANVSCCGIPTVDSMGIGGGKVHTIDEYAIVHTLAEQAKRVAAAILYLK